jgi:hypothetical protein
MNPGLISTKYFFNIHLNIFSHHFINIPIFSFILPVEEHEVGGTCGTDGIEEERV